MPRIVSLVYIETFAILEKNQHNKTIFLFNIAILANKRKKNEQDLNTSNLNRNDATGLYMTKMDKRE
jgi:hypothetical protein